MPIISLGGTSLLTSSVSFGIILGISRKIDAEENQPKEKKTKVNEHSDDLDKTQEVA